MHCDTVTQSQLADVCAVLELSNPSETASRLDEDEKGIISGQGRAAAGGSLRCT